MVQAEQGLKQRGQTTGCSGMSQTCCCAGNKSRAGQGLLQTACFCLILLRNTGCCSPYHADSVCRNSCLSNHLMQQRLIALLKTAVTGADRTDHTIDTVIVLFSIGEALQHQGAGPFTDQYAVCLLVKHQCSALCRTGENLLLSQHCPQVAGQVNCTDYCLVKFQVLQ